jgi:ADP-ribosyl-[dinitrogen reductase] hydrolase
MSITFQNAMRGALVADAVAMPVHWYYDTQALDRDYGVLGGYVAPKNPHAGSILWRSKYKARNKRGEILHDQAQYWGQRGVHYHQFLKAGENTINFKLSVELYLLIKAQGGYNAEQWLQRYIDCMLLPGWHQDTYLEEYHRAFFDNYARGQAPAKCGIDDLHIGGLSHVPALLAALEVTNIAEPDALVAIATQHVQLTHHNQHVVRATEALCRILAALQSGSDLRTAITTHGHHWATPGQLDTWSRFDDRAVIGKHLTMACYLPESFTASLYLCWKYADNFSGGILANAHCGGDSCHRGAVVGALLGAANGIEDKWLTDLQTDN